MNDEHVQTTHEDVLWTIDHSLRALSLRLMLSKIQNAESRITESLWGVPVPSHVEEMACIHLVDWVKTQKHKDEICLNKS